MSSKPSLGRSVNAPSQDHIGSWSGGWYVFEDGNVVGPLDAKDTFSRGEKTSSGQTRLVSRKGFTQWYPIQDFAVIHAMAERYSDELGRAGATNQSLQRNLVSANQLGVKSHDVQPAVKTISAVQRELNSLSNSGADAAKIHQVSVTPPVKKLSAKEKRRLIEEDRRSRKLSSKQAAQARKASHAQNIMPSLSFEQQYLQVASRLRLGVPASPIARAFVYTPLSLGVYWWPWLARTAEEVSWHLNGASRMNFIFPMWMSLIPGVHLILANFVARMVSQMEEQNGYRTVNPVFATIAAIFPPFYIAMIQSALNRHWRLHVYHSVKK